MTIQINGDNNLHVKEAFGEKLQDILKDKLDRFSEHITRLEVHLSDENGHKSGAQDKRCLLEARLEGKQPIAVSEQAENYTEALNAAVKKLTASLDTVIGKMQNHHRG